MEIQWRLIKIQWRFASSNPGEIVSTNGLMNCCLKICWRYMKPLHWDMIKLW